MSYVAFFDVDHTILKINSGEALLRRAYKNRLLSLRKLIHAYYLALLYRLKIMDPFTIIEKLYGWLSKSSVDDVETLCTEIVEKDLIPAIRPEIINEIKMHREQGADLVILSSAIASICFRLAKHLEMHSVICTELEIVNQQYTGQTTGKFCFREEKLDRMNRYLHTHHYAGEDSYYYGDSIDDVKVLQAVGHPVCVNPDKRLEKTARVNHWIMHTWK